jgi:hypothetical protein
MYRLLIVVGIGSHSTSQVIECVSQAEADKTAEAVLKQHDGFLIVRVFKLYDSTDKPARTPHGSTVGFTRVDTLKDDGAIVTITALDGTVHVKRVIPKSAIHSLPDYFETLAHELRLMMATGL